LSSPIPKLAQVLLAKARELTAELQLLRQRDILIFHASFGSYRAILDGCKLAAYGMLDAWNDFNFASQITLHVCS
jgi:hypothetical protein